MNCKKCGAEYTNGIMCPVCGAEPPRRKGGVNPLFWIVPLAAVLIIAVGIGAFFLISRGSESDESEGMQSGQNMVLRDPDILRFVLAAEGAQIEDGADIDSFFMGETLLNASDVRSATAVYQEGRYLLRLEFTEEATIEFAEITRENVGRYLGILFKGEVICFPMINDEIADGQALIEGGFTMSEAKEMAELIRENSKNLREK